MIAKYLASIVIKLEFSKPQVVLVTINGSPAAWGSFEFSDTTGFNIARATGSFRDEVRVSGGAAFCVVRYWLNTR